MPKIGRLSRLMRDNSPQSVVKTSLLVFCASLAALTLLAWGISFICARFLHLGYPFNTPLHDPAWRFSDLSENYHMIRNLSAGGGILKSLPPGGMFNYPAPALYVMAFFIDLFPSPVAALLSFDVGAVLVALLVLLKAALKGTAVSARWIVCTLLFTALCSYPFAFLIDRANLEGVVWFFTFIGLAFFVGKRYMTSALFFAAAICVKPFPALFILLFLRRRRYREIAVATVAIVAANLLAMAALGPTIAIAYRDLQWGVREYVKVVVTSYPIQEMGFDHSFFSCVKDVIRLSLGWPRIDTLHGVFTTAYLIWLPLSLLIVVACGVFFWRKPVLNQLFAIVLMMLLIPPCSYDYVLTHLYLPWGVFVIFLVRDVARGRVKFSLGNCLWILIPCAVLMTPQTYLTLTWEGFAGQLKAVAEIVLLFVVAHIDMPASLFGELPPDGSDGQSERLATKQTNLSATAR